MKTRAEIRKWWENAPRTEFSEERYPVTNFFRPSFWFTYLGLLRSQWYPFERLKHIQEKKLRSLIKHCYHNVPYYRRIFKDLGISPQDIETVKDLQYLPLLTKGDVKNNAVELIADTVNLNKVQVHFTGGSTGEPLAVLVSQEMMIFEMAILFRFLSWMGISPWHKQVHFRTTRGWGRGSWDSSTSSLFGLVTKISPLDLSTEAIQDYLKTLLKIRPHLITGNPTTLDTVARFVSKHGNQGLSPKAIEVSSEPLYDNQRKAIESALNGPLFDFYGAMEHSTTAQECESHTGLHVNMEYGILELLPLDGLEGSTNIRQIVGTCLENLAMPLLRYQIQDLAVQSSSSCPCGRQSPILEKVYGKKRDLIVLRNGQTVGGEIFTLGLEEVRSLLKYRVVQKSFDRIIVKIVVGENFQEQELNNALLRIQSVFTCPIEIKYEIVDSIETTIQGKHHIVISDVL